MVYLRLKIHAQQLKIHHWKTLFSLLSNKKNILNVSLFKHWMLHLEPNHFLIPMTKWVPGKNILFFMNKDKTRGFWGPSWKSPSYPAWRVGWTVLVRKQLESPMYDLNNSFSHNIYIHWGKYIFLEHNG